VHRFVSCTEEDERIGIADKAVVSRYEKYYGVCRKTMFLAVRRKSNEASI
jgi:hypothetical protein